MSDVRWGIVGPGEIARVFARSVASANAGTIAAAFGRDPDRRAAFCSDTGAEPRASLEELVTSDIDAVYVASPHTAHAEAVRAAMGAGRAVLCEKPMTTGAEETEALFNEARAQNALLVEAWMYRTHPVLERALALIDAGVIGEVTNVASYFGFNGPEDPEHRLLNPALGGGAILDIGGYPVSFALLVARSIGALDGLTIEDAVGEVGPTGVDIHAEALLQFDGGLTANVLASISRDLGTRAVITGTEGVLDVVEPFIPEGRRDGRIGRIQWGPTGTEHHKTVDAPHDCYGLEALAVGALLRGESAAIPATMVGPDESIAIARVLDAWRAALD